MSDKVSRLNVLAITRKFPPAMGGMETYSVELAKEIGSRSNLSLWALPGNSDGTPPRFLALIRFGLLTVWRMVRGPEKFDIVHVFDVSLWPVAWLAVRRKQARAAVLSAHGTDVSYAFRKTARGRLYGQFCFLGAKLFPEAAVVANSGATADLARRIGFKNVKVVELAARFTPLAPRKKTNRILFIGRLLPRKGCGWFVQNVLPLLPDDIRLTIAGRRDDPAESWVLEHERVDYLGVLNPQELANASAAAICVVVPNQDMGIGSFEGFGLVAPEAAAAGGVVIASELFGLTSAVKRGLTGFLIKADDPRAWADQVVEVSRWSHDDRERFAASSSAAAREYYSWPRVADNTLEIYDSVLESARRRTS